MVTDFLQLDWCDRCERVVPDGVHDYQAHGGLKEYAEEREQFRQHCLKELERTS
jgi:hypothetical protein